MTVHVVVRYVVIDEEAYGRYRKLAGPTVAAHGGSFVVKGRMTEHLEGSDSATHFALIAFPSVEMATAWSASEGYQQARDARMGAGEMTLSIVA